MSVDEAHLKELEAGIREQFSLLEQLQTAVRQQEERLAALRAELEGLQQLLAEKGAAQRLHDKGAGKQREKGKKAEPDTVTASPAIREKPGSKTRFANNSAKRRP